MINSLPIFSRIKYYLIWLSLSSLCTSLSSCHLGSSSTSQSEKPYTIIMYMIGTPQPDTPLVMAKLNQYLRAKIGAQLEFHQIDWSNYDQKIKMIMLSGQPYDIAFTSSWSNNYYLQASRGAFYPLNQLLESYGQDILHNLNPLFLNGAKINGELYAIPTNKEIGRQLVYRINQHWLIKTGFKLRQVKTNSDLLTLKSLEPLLAAAKRIDPSIVPYAIFKNTTYQFGDMEMLNGDLPGAIRVSDKQLKVFNQYRDPEFIAMLQLHHHFYQQGYIAADAAQIDDNPALAVTGKWVIDQANYQPYADLLWSQTNGYPIISVAAHPPLVTSNTVSGAMMAISINAHRPDIDMKFLNLLNSDRYVRNLLQYGIEGIHYQKIGPQRIRLLARYAEKYNMPGFALGNLLITYLLENDPDDKWVQLKAWNQRARVSPSLGFNLDLTPLAATYTAIATIIDKYKGGLVTGQSDPSLMLPRLNAELAQAGVDKLLAEEQRQLDAWQRRKQLNP